METVKNVIGLFQNANLIWNTLLIWKISLKLLRAIGCNTMLF